MSKKIVFFLSFCVCFLNFFVSAGVIKDDLFKLDIVHYNDFHSRFEETSVQYPDCKTNNTQCLGGFARLYHEIIALLKEKPDALVLDAGDVFQGTYWYTLLKWNVTQRFINMLPNDAHAIGNHEFDDGVQGLGPYLAGLNAPVVAANIDTSKEPLLNGLYHPHIILERRGKKIGIIGVTTTETKYSSRPGNVLFLDPLESVKNESQFLTNKGVNIIIVLSHCGLDVDKKIAREVGEHVDIIVGGHSHSLLWNGESPSNEQVSGPYPVVEVANINPDHKVLIITASAFTKYLGNLTVYFDKQGELVAFNGEPVFLNRSIPEDPTIKSLLQPYAEELHEMVNKVVGFASTSLMVTPCGAGECALGDLVADAYLNATKEMNVSNLPHVAFAIRNNIRGSMAEGDITRAAIINMSPFTNKIVTLVISGKYLFDIMERCLTNYWREDPFLGPWMPQVAGIELTLNTTSKKVVSMFYKGDKLTPIIPENDYQFITLDFLAIGGSGFTMIKEHGRDVRLIGVDAKVLENYISKISPVTNKLDNRLIIVR